MESLFDYFSYNKDCDIDDIYYRLFEQLKVLHSKGLYVNSLDSYHIYHDVNDNLVYTDIVDNKDEINGINSNILSLSKMMIGTYLSIGTGFQDYSFANNSWFMQNIDSISEVVPLDNIKDYLNKVFASQTLYYSDVVNEINTSNTRQNRNNKVKTLRNGNIDYLEVDSNDEKSAFAYVNLLFYPVILFCLSIIVYVCINCFNLLN